MLSIQAAMDVFINGWVYARRFEETITMSKPGMLTHLTFGTPPSQTHEFMVPDGSAPDEVLNLIRQTGQPSHALTVFTTQRQQTHDAYTAHGYRPQHPEYLMACDLTETSFVPDEKISVRLIESEQDRRWFNLQREREIIPPQALSDRLMNYYFVELDGQLVCEGRWILTAGQYALIDSVYTTQTYRRRGLGQALMLKMLSDAFQRGAKQSVLVASGDGHKLYSTLGYTVLADILIFEASRT
jgi:predicted GNAT family acetyltransferase